MPAPMASSEQRALLASYESARERELGESCNCGFAEADYASASEEGPRVTESGYFSLDITQLE